MPFERPTFDRKEWHKKFLTMQDEGRLGKAMSIRHETISLWDGGSWSPDSRKKIKVTLKLDAFSNSLWPSYQMGGGRPPAGQPQIVSLLGHKVKKVNILVSCLDQLTLVLRSRTVISNVNILGKMRLIFIWFCCFWSAFWRFGLSKKMPWCCCWLFLWECKTVGVWASDRFPGTFRSLPV
jgi:hypothetical protein